jgi:hypothetical protein
MAEDYSFVKEFERLHSVKVGKEKPADFSLI